MPVTGLFDSRVGRALHTLRVLRRATAVNIRARSEYRVDFILSILFGILWQTSTLAFAGVLLTRFDALGDFPARGVLLIVGMRLMSHGLYAVSFDNFMLLPMLVDEGRVDFYFLRPLSVFTQVALSNFNVNALGDLVVGATTCGFGVFLAHLSWTFRTVVFFIAAIVGGTLIEATVQIVLASLVLGSPGSRFLGLWVEEIMSTFGNYPLSILPGAVRILFTSVLPLAFVAYLPVEVLLGRAPRHGIGSIIYHWSPAMGFLLFLVGHRIWSWSLQRYRSAGG
jgi:ABC-2 type transport system permease protein